MSIFRLHIIPILLLIHLGGSVLAQDLSVDLTQNVTIDKEKSRLWIEGRSNVSHFNCRAATYDSSPVIEEERIDVEVDIEVKSFDCGKRRMNRDLYETLLSDKHPFISFEYTDTPSVTYDDSQDLYNLMVKGNLTVAGHKKEIEFPMKAFVLDNGTIRAVGETELRMTDYNVEPPTALLGMVRVDDLLTVHFELYASIPHL